MPSRSSATTPFVALTAIVLLPALALVGLWRFASGQSDGDAEPVPTTAPGAPAPPAPRPPLSTPLISFRRVPGLIARGSAVVVVGLVGLGALITAVALILRGGEVIALYEAAHLELLGATVVTLAQLAYLPTVVVWGLAFVAGPGFALGEGTSVSPAGTQVGVVPGIPILGLVPESTTPWLLLLALAPVALGAFAGWIARSRLLATPASRVAGVAPAAAPESTTATTDPARTSALEGLLAETAALRTPEPDPDPGPDPGPSAPDEDPIGARLVIALGIAALAAGAAALLAFVASGSIGPGSLAEMGPDPGPVALAVGIEVILGAAVSSPAPACAPPQAVSRRGCRGAGHAGR